MYKQAITSKHSTPISDKQPPLGLICPLLVSFVTHADRNDWRSTEKSSAQIRVMHSAGERWINQSILLLLVAGLPLPVLPRGDGVDLPSDGDGVDLDVGVLVVRGGGS